MNGPDQAKRAGLKQFSRFFVVGAIGFVVDAGVLQLLISLFDLSPLLARIPSFLIAVVSTWSLHRSWTFKQPEKTKRPLRELLEFMSSQLLGILVNYGIFSGLVLYVSPFTEYPVLALAVASVVVMGLTFSMAKWIFLSGSRKAEVGE